MGIFACTEKKYTHTARCSHFVFRNNTVCSGKRRGFPVIYRQSDEARQTKPPIISFPLISPLSWAIVQPAAGSLSRLQIGWQKRNGNQPFRFSDCQKASQSLRPQAQIKFQAFLPAACTSAKILLGSQTCERKRVRCGEPQPFPTRAQRSGSRLRACQKNFLTRSKAERQSAVPLLLILLRRPSPRRTMRRRSDRRTPARRRSACCSFSAPATSSR